MKPDCRCGHPHEWHTHLHTRDYCGTCPDCRSYRPPRATLGDWLWSARAALSMWLARR